MGEDFKIMTEEINNVIKTEIINQSVKETKRVVMLLADLWDDTKIDRTEFEKRLGCELRASTDEVLSELKKLKEHPEYFER